MENQDDTFFAKIVKLISMLWKNSYKQAWVIAPKLQEIGVLNINFRL